MWARWLRSELVASSGRISSIDAPVVPISDASTPPSARKAVLLRGMARRSPSRWMPPQITNSAASSATKPAYSCRVWVTSSPSPPAISHAAVGTPSSSETGVEEDRNRIER